MDGRDPGASGNRLRRGRGSYRTKARLYGENELGGLHVMYVLTEEPGVHGLPEKPQLVTYPDFDENSLPDWYTQAVADGRLAAFPPEAQPDWYLRPAPAEVGTGWVAPTLWSLLGIGVIGGAAALWIEGDFPARGTPANAGQNLASATPASARWR